MTLANFTKVILNASPFFFKLWAQGSKGKE